MGQPVVHFEVIGSDGEGLRAYYSELFGWEFQEIGGPMDYAVVPREGNTNSEGTGIGGGIGGVGDDDSHHVTFYVEVPDIEAALGKAESFGGKRVSGPDEVPGAGISIAHFSDPEGHLIGLVTTAS